MVKKTDLPSNQNTCCEVVETAHFITFSRTEHFTENGEMYRELHGFLLGIYKL